MSDFLEDDSKWLEYFDDVDGLTVRESLQLTIFEWYVGSGSSPRELQLSSATELLRRDQSLQCSLRIVAAPYRSTDSAESQAMKLLFRHYAVPSCLLSERALSVTHSFGSRTLPGAWTAWCHFLCKDLYVHHRDEQPTIIDNGVYQDKLSFANTSWRISDYYLHVRKSDKNARCVTMLCFGATDELVDRFRGLLGKISWHDAVHEPLLLFAIVYDDLYHLFDDLAWQLADVFRPFERAILTRASHKRETNGTEAVDFTGLHNIAKHCVYFNEAASAAVLTLNNMLAYLQSERRSNFPDTHLRLATEQALSYRKGTFQSTQLRLQSLSARMDNILSLSFHLVTQQDSRIMQNDSNAMKAIAVLTLVFLPLTGIGSVFSTPFFEVNFDDTSRVLQVARCFWIFWVITIPITILLFGAWWLWYRQTKLIRFGGASSSKQSQRPTKTAESPL